MGHTNKPTLRALENRKGTPRQSRGNPKVTPEEPSGNPEGISRQPRGDPMATQARELYLKTRICIEVFMFKLKSFAQAIMPRRFPQAFRFADALI